jgi:hypothetical protein
MIFSFASHSGVEGSKARLTLAFLTAPRIGRLPDRGLTPNQKIRKAFRTLRGEPARSKLRRSTRAGPRDPRGREKNMRIVLLASLVSAAFGASAQNDDLAAQQRALADQIAAAQAAGEANASRPGDESLSCEALQAEMVAIAQSPEMQAFTQTAAAQAQADLAQINAAQAAQQQAAAAGRPRLFRQMVQGVASGVVPGAGQAQAQAQQAQAIAQNAQLQQQTQQNQQEILALGGQVANLAGPAMRGQRVFELAQARDCAWLKEGGGPPPGALPPGALPPGALPTGALPPGALPPGALPPGAAPPR